MHDNFRYFDINSYNGYPISAKSTIPENSRKIVIICHGYGGSMDARTVDSLAPSLYDKGIGTVAFNWPGHGNSMMSGKWFTVKNCLRDLDSVYEYICEKYPQTKIYLMGTSYGAYIALLYNSIYAKNIDKLVAKSCALDMKDIFEKKLIGDDLKQLKNYGSILVEDIERPLTITEEYYAELIKYNAVSEFNPGRTDMLFIHGSDDEIAPYYVIKEFCDENKLALETISGADHFFSNDNHLSICNNAIIKFFMG